jgi:hypothetical protein
MSQSSTTSTSSPTSDTSTSTRVDELLKGIIGVGLTWEELDELSEEVEKLVTNRMEGVASTNILSNETNIVKRLRIHIDQCIVLLGDLLQLEEEILELAWEANAAEAAEKERREKYKRDWAVYSEEISSRVNRFI